MDRLLRAGRPASALAAALACLVAATFALAFGAGVAHAGGWTLVSCTNPDGTPAPVDGWTPGVWAGTPVTGSGAVDSCAAGGALSAVSAGAQPAFTGPEWVFTAPGGDLIAGGTVTTTLTAPQGQAWIATPQPSFGAADMIVGCTAGGPCGAAGTASGVVPISHPGGTTLYAPALCVTLAAPTCPPGGLNAQIDIKAADIELLDSATPQAVDVRGRLVAGRARGVAPLHMLASDPATGGGDGPGVYGVTVSIDGAVVYAGPPNAAKGTCPSVGTDPVTGRQMFDDAQPCPPTARVNVGVDTSSLADGRHLLTVVVTDAGGDAATVVNRSITTFNPLVSPAPPAGTVATRLTVGWTGASPSVAVHSVSARRLPRHGRVSLRCLRHGSRRCPGVRGRTVGVRHIGRLWSALKHAELRSGERLRISISAPRRRTETIQYRIHATGRPGQRLLLHPH